MLYCYDVFRFDERSQCHGRRNHAYTRGLGLELGLSTYAGYGQYAGICGDDEPAPPHTEDVGDTSSTTGNPPPRLLGEVGARLGESYTGVLGLLVFVAEEPAVVVLARDGLTASCKCMSSVNGNKC